MDPNAGTSAERDAAAAAPTARTDCALSMIGAVVCAKKTGGLKWALLAKEQKATPPLGDARQTVTESQVLLTAWPLAIARTSPKTQLHPTSSDCAAGVKKACQELP